MTRSERKEGPAAAGKRIGKIVAGDTRQAYSGLPLTLTRKSRDRLILLPLDSRFRSRQTCT